jgi:hypothetical protein
MRVFKHVIPGFLAVNFYFSVSVSAPTVDNSVTSSLANQASQAERLDAIKEAFQHTWKGYQHCFGSDGFFPSFSVPGTKPYWKCTSGE